jgi:hypothetical protein
MAKVALILCGGSQTRWGNDTPKQLMPVLGETLVERVSRQVRAIGFTPLIVGPKDVFGSHGSCLPHGKTITDSIDVSRRFFEDCTVVLCGDVVWGDGAIGHLANDGAQRSVLGSVFTAEIFGMCWNHCMGPDKGQLEHAARHGGRLWHLYRLMINQPIDKHVCDLSLWTEINDGFTQDFDHQNQYQEWTAKHQ